MKKQPHRSHTRTPYRGVCVRALSASRRTYRTARTSGLCALRACASGTSRP